MRTLLFSLTLSLLACTQPPPAVRAANKLELIGALQLSLLSASEAEKSAVLAITDEESVAFAQEAKKANAEVERARLELRQRVEADGRANEVAALERFETSWQALAAVDARVLTLAVANTNLKASRLAAGDAAAAVNELVDALTVIELVTTSPATLRELSGAAVAALRMHALLAPHIASADGQEMTRLEQQLRTQQALVEQALADARRSAKDRAAAAWEAWARYQHFVEEIVRLSRLNTNVLSTDLSVHEKREVMIAAQNALAALRTEVQDVPRATR